MKKLALAVAIVSVGAVAVITTAIAKNGGGGGNGHAFSTKLTGYEEIIPGATPGAEGGAVSTTGHGWFSAKVRDNPLRIEYRLRYDDLEGTDTLFAHPHFGQPGTLGGISALLCDSDPANNATVPDCTNTEGDITGTIDAAEVIGPVGQGIEAGNITELIRAMRNGAVYVNVHTNKWPSGEIRGQVDKGRHFGFFRGKGKHKDDD
jgi:CHRD domain